MKRALVVVFFVLMLPVFASTAHVFPFSRYEYQKEYENFVKRVTGDLRRAGFALNVSKAREITENSGRGVFVDVRINKYPDFLKKYLGEPKSHYFVLQALELENDVVFYIKVVKDKDLVWRLSFSKYAEKKNFYYFETESMIPDAKAKLILALFGLDCESRYSGITQKNEKKEPLVRPVRNFSYDIDEFITFFFRELKSYGFKYTVVERYPIVEIRIFEFPAALSFLLPEPASAFFLLENKKIDSQERILLMRVDRQYKTLNILEVLIFDNKLLLEKTAVESAQKVFANLYLPECSSYEGPGF